MISIYDAIEMPGVLSKIHSIAKQTYIDFALWKQRQRHALTEREYIGTFVTMLRTNCISSYGYGSGDVKMQALRAIGDKIYDRRNYRGADLLPNCQSPGWEKVKAIMDIAMREAADEVARSTESSLLTMKLCVEEANRLATQSKLLAGWGEEVRDDLLSIAVSLEEV